MTPATDQGASPGPLQWCHGCGDRVLRLNHEGFCPLCEEVDARLEAHVASAMADLTQRIVELVLCYLHPDDVQKILADAAGEAEPHEPRLAEVYERSHRYVEGRERRAAEFRAGDPPADG